MPGILFCPNYNNPGYVIILCYIYGILWYNGINIWKLKGFKRGDAAMKIKKIDVRDIEGFRLGNAEDAEGGTGVTVIIAEEGAVGGVDVRGGAPATRETELFRSENTVEAVNAVVLSGGSAFGLEASSGVMRELASRGVGFRLGDINVPIVAGASLFDLEVGSPDVFPDREMGIQAVENAYNGDFESGNHGAGTGASVGKSLGMDRAMKTGLGTYACGDDLMQVGAIVAVNAVSDVYNGAGNIIAGLRSGDGSAILGTIKVLREMMYPEAEPDLEIEDFGATAASRFKRNEPVHTADRDSSDGESKSDIAKAILAAYELSNQEPQEPEEAFAETYDEYVYSEDNVSESDETFYPGDEDSDRNENLDEYLEADADEIKPNSELTDTFEHYPEYEDSAGEQATIDAEDHEPIAEADEPQIAEPDFAREEEPDPYELSEEEKADMGYDIPFNTTIGCLITNAKLTKAQANKLASILHDAYARAIKPVHSTLDGDTIFVLSTCRQEINFDAFAALATDVMQYAVIDGALSAEGAYGLPASKDIIHR